MKLNEIYHSRYFRSLWDQKKDELTFKNICSQDFKTNVDMQVGVIKTLSGYGNTDEEIAEAILKYNTVGWKDYDITLEMVRERRGNDNKDGTRISKLTSASTMHRNLIFKDALDYIDYFLQHYGLPPERVPSDMMGAVMHHVMRGRIALPKMKDEKRVCFYNRSPSVRYLWKNGETDYSKKILSLDDVKQWDYSYGICLIVPTDWRDDCYLDIDVKSEKHQDGIENFDESVLEGFHYEKTKNGGFHVFGKGHPQKPPAGMGLQMVSTLIVTYPTEGYKLKDVK